jgi:DNA repair ATPase RecN
MENEQKIKDSKGNIYDSCPYIDKIISTLDEQFSFYNNIKSNLEIIRKINRELRHLKDGRVLALEQRILALEEISDKYEIVNDLLGIDSKDLRWVKLNTKDIADKLERLENLEKENEELKQEINNLTNKN